MPDGHRGVVPGPTSDPQSGPQSGLPAGTAPRSSRRPRGWWALGGILPVLVLVLLQALASHDNLQSLLQCPGSHCTASLSTVFDEAAHVPGVTSVERTYRRQDSVDPPQGGIDVRASAADRTAASALATRLRDLYLASDIPSVDSVSVQVVPDPERSVDAVSSAATAPPSRSATPVPCAEEACTAAVAAFRAAYADSDLSVSTSLTSVSRSHPGAPNSSADSAPVFTVDLDAGTAVLDDDQIAQVRTRLLAVVHTSALDRVGIVTVHVDYRRLVVYDFSYSSEFTPATPR